jgi:hypothetical protein
MIINISSNTGSFYPLDYHDGTHLHAPRHDGRLTSLAITCSLIDYLAYFHPPPYPSTYARGPNRLDYIFVSDDIIHAVTRSGILPLYSVFTGDHNACYVDIDATLLFAEPTYHIALPSHRGLQLRDPRKVTACIKILLEQTEYHKIYEKVSDLFQSAIEGNWTPTHTEIYEKLDTILTESMLYAERTITKYKTSLFEWSIHLAQAFQAVCYWKLRIKRQLVRIYRLCGKMQPVLEPVSQTTTKPTTSYSIGRIVPTTLQATSPLTT